LKIKTEDKNRKDQYALLYSQETVTDINRLNLPRYGLGNYVTPSPHRPPTQAEDKILDDLSRAGKRLMGFCRTNLFKRLESSGQSFLLSVERHLLRNYIYLHAIENRQALPIGPQGAELLDSRIYDEDADEETPTLSIFEENNDTQTIRSDYLNREAEIKQRAAEIYSEYNEKFRKRFKWLSCGLFVKELKEDLEFDNKTLINILNKCGEWVSDDDAKLNMLEQLLASHHPAEKIIVFTQFADTVRYLEQQLKLRGINSLSGVTGKSSNPTALAHRFSPVSNQKRSQIKPEDELRILIATDVLSEGQNLQDCSIIINYDLPWAIIRLIQRAGRVDRIGQEAGRIICYSFLPADGVERIIRLRARVRQRLRENAEVVGTDESFFEDDQNEQAVRDLFTEKSGIIDGDDDTEVDLASYAYQIWKNAIDRDKTLEKTIPELPSVVYSIKPHSPTEQAPEGALVYVRTAEGNNALAWVDKEGKSVTESQFAILKAAECSPDTKPLERHQNHHILVKQGVEIITNEEKT